MDVRDMSFFPDEKFGAVIDKGLASWSSFYTPSNFPVFNTEVCPMCWSFNAGATTFHSWPLDSWYRDTWFVDGMWGFHISHACYSLFSPCSNSLILCTQCGTDAPISAAQMLGEVSRLWTLWTSQHWLTSVDSLLLVLYFSTNFWLLLL